MNKLAIDYCPFCCCDHVIGNHPEEGETPADYWQRVDPPSNRTDFLNENERRFLNHMGRWGSDGYPIMRVKSGYIWTEFCGIKGAPTVYKTMRAAASAIEAYIDILVDRAAGRLSRELQL